MTNNPTFIGLHNHSNYSHDCISKIKDIVSFAKKDGQTAFAITDHGNINGAIEFYKECIDQQIKPIIGIELYITQNNRSITDRSSDNKSLNHLVVLAKNKAGYQNLLKLVKISNLPEHFYYRPRIDFATLANHSEGLIVLNGHIGTSIANTIFFNYDSMRTCETIECCYEYFDPSYEDKFLTEAHQYIDVFGKDFYTECQFFDPDDVVQQALAQSVYELSKKHNIQCVGTGDAHYISAEDQIYHKTFVCIAQNRKIKQAGFSRYLDSGIYGIVTQEQARKCYPPELLEATLEIANKVEEFSLFRNESIPNFPVKNKNCHIKKLAMEQIGVKCPNTSEYQDRLKMELEVIKEADLAGYFLIVSDYMKWAKSQDILTGPARGSSAGCLTSYLLDITEVDPIQYGLLFERFYNPARAAAKALPDIDSDFPASRRDDVINYVREKYGHDKVCGVVTFNTLQGKGALKDVLRIYEACSFSEMNKISELIPSRDKISDKLSDFKDETGSSSLLEYLVHKEPDLLHDYVYLNDDGEIDGPYAFYVKIAIKLEGAIKTESKHACAVLISDQPIDEYAPLIRDKNSNELICGYDMDSFPRVGLTKFDMLGISDLDSLMCVNDLLGEIEL